MSTVPTNKLPFGIQTILNDGDIGEKFSESDRLMSTSFVTKEGYGNDNFLKHYCIASRPVLPPYQIPCRNINMTRLENESAQSTSNYCKFIRNIPLASGTETGDYCCCSRIPMSTDYPPVRYGFPSTSVAVTSCPDQLSAHSGAKPGHMGVSNQSFFAFASQSCNSKIFNISDTQRNLSNSIANKEHGGFCSVSDPSTVFPSLPIINITQPKEIIQRNCSVTPRRVGHPYQSRTPARNKKPRTSFTKKQIASLEMRFLAQKYLASAERVNLANELEMSDAQVKTWFQNRRTKWRRQEAEEKEYENKANARMMPTFSTCFFARPDIIL